MKIKFESWFRGFMLLLLLGLVWGIWLIVQSATDASAAQAGTNDASAHTNAAPALLSHLERFQTNHFSFSFGLDRIALLREHEFLGEPLWKYAESAIYILLALYLSKFIDHITRFWLKRLAQKTARPIDDLVLHLLRGPIKVVCFVVLVNIGLSIFDWSAKAQNYLSKVLVLVVAGSLTYLALRLLTLLLDAWKRRIAHQDRRFNDQLFSFISKSLTAFIIVVAVLVTAQNLGINMTAAITSLSIGGLAVGLAAQDTLANLFGAIAVFTDKPFVLGDYVKLDGAEGEVEEVGLRSTRLRNPEGYLVAVPNKTMGNGIITNITRRATIKTVMNLTLSRALSVAKIREALAAVERIYRSNPHTKDVWVSFNQFAGANINIVIWHWWKGTNYQEYLAGMQEMNLAVKERFDADQIAFA